MPWRTPTRLSEDLNMVVAKKVADTSPDVPAAKRAKILSEDDGNEGEVGIAERVGGENGRQPQLAVSNAAGSNGPKGANAPDEGAEKGEDIVENVMRDENDIGAQEPEEQDENPPAWPRSEPAFGPGGCQEDAPEEGEKRVPIGDASADVAGSPVEPAKEPESNTMDQEQSAGARPVVAANSADASGPSDAAAPDNTLRTAQHAILLRQQAIKYKGCCQVDDCLNPRKQPTANSRMPLTCAEHNGMLSLTYGGEASRECQACRAFHPVSAFDRDNKTCETRLLRKKLRYRAKTLQQREEHRGQVGKQKARRHEAALQAVAAATAQPGVGVGLGQFSHLQGPAGFMLPFGGKFPGVADKDGGAGALAAPRESIASVNPYGMFPGLAHMPFGQGAVEGSAAAAASAFAASFGSGLGSDDNKIAIPQPGGINLQTLAGFPTRSNPAELAESSPAVAQAYLAALVQGNTGLSALALQGAGLPGGIHGLAGLQNPEVLANLARQNNLQEQVAALRANHMLRIAQAAEMQASVAIANSRSTGGDILNRQNLYPHLASDPAQAGCSIM